MEINSNEFIKVTSYLIKSIRFACFFLNFIVICGKVSIYYYLGVCMNHKSDIEMVNMKDVARYAKVSIATVSRVINNKGYVSDATRIKVENAIEELDYQKNTLARSLVTKRSHVIALILDDITNPFYPQLTRGVEDTAEKNNLSVILCNIESNAEKEIGYINNLIGRQVDGLVFVASRVKKGVYGNQIKIKVPVVRLDRQIFVPNCDSVLLDQFSGAYDITKFLIEQGHKHIAHITGPIDYFTAQERNKGYAQALHDNGIRNVKRLIVRGNYSLESGRISMEQLLNLDKKPTAVFVANDLMAFGAMDVLIKRGIKIPEDIAVAGFDDIPFASIYNPSLTTVSQPTFQMGSLAMQMLIDRLSGNASSESREIILKPTITIRESTGNITQRGNA